MTNYLKQGKIRGFVFFHKVILFRLCIHFLQVFDDSLSCLNRKD